MRTVSKQPLILQYVFVALAVSTVTMLTSRVQLFSEGLIGALYLVVVALVAAFGEYAVGIFAIGLSILGLNYASAPLGFDFSQQAVFKTVEFLVAGSIIFYLSWRVRKLQTDNGQLVEAATELQAIIKKLRVEAKGNKAQAARLRIMNTELERLVDEFLENDEYWDRKWQRSKLHQESKSQEQ